MISKSKRSMALLLAFCIFVIACCSHFVYGWKSDSSLPYWVVGSGRDSWTQTVEEMAAAYKKQDGTVGIEPTGLHLNYATWNPGPSITLYPGITYLDLFDGDHAADGLDVLKDAMIFCVASHTPGGDLRGGSQAFLEQLWDEENIPKWVGGTGDEKK